MTYLYTIFAKNADKAHKCIFIYMNKIRFSIKEIDRLMYDILSLLRYFEES